VRDQFRCGFVHGPDVSARATEIVDVTTGGAQGRQKPDSIIAARWTLRDYRHGSNRRKSRPTPERIPRRRFSMTKRNAHASQHRYANLLAWANSRTRASPHFGQGVTGRPSWSLGLGMFNLSGWFCVPQGACQLSCQGTDNLRVQVITKVRPVRRLETVLTGLGGHPEKRTLMSPLSESGPQPPLSSIGPRYATSLVRWTARNARRFRSSSILFCRIGGAMFMRVNSRCAHQLRPPIGVDSYPTLSRRTTQTIFPTSVSERFPQGFPHPLRRGFRMIRTPAGGVC